MNDSVQCINSYILTFTNLIKERVDAAESCRTIPAKSSCVTEIYYLIEIHIDTVYQYACMTSKRRAIKWINFIHIAYNNIIERENDFENDNAYKRYKISYPNEMKQLIEQMCLTKRVLDPYVNNQIDTQPLAELSAQKHNYNLRPRTKEVKYV